MVVTGGCTSTSNRRDSASFSPAMRTENTYAPSRRPAYSRGLAHGCQPCSAATLGASVDLSSHWKPSAGRAPLAVRKAKPGAPSAVRGSGASVMTAVRTSQVAEGSAARRGVLVR